MADSFTSKWQKVLKPYSPVSLVKSAAKTGGRLVGALGRIGNATVGAAKKATAKEIDPYAAGAAKSAKGLAAIAARAGRTARVQRSTDQANAEKAYTVKGWSDTTEGKAAYAKHQSLMSHGDAAQASQRATTVRGKGSKILEAIGKKFPLPKKSLPEGKPIIKKPPSDDKGYLNALQRGKGAPNMSVRPPIMAEDGTYVPNNFYKKESK